ncbi:MAG: hypothetical protein QNJ42_14580 [Crocosphaera sp.]|nr:hypothetical protein [Crocosphaera sp.]
MADWLVDDSGNGDFLTIAEAIAAAEKGDKIIVTGGDDNLHQEANILIDKKLTIKSDSDGATIDAQGIDRVFLIDDGDVDSQVDVKLEGLAITGGNTEDIGGAILNKEKLTIKDSIITGNTATIRGGGIYNMDGELKIENSIIKENTALRSSGGGISNTGKLEVKDSVIENNFASAGGGIANAGEVKIENTIISGHTSFMGAGIYNLNGDLKIEKNTIIKNNTSIIDGAGILNIYGSTTIEDSVITDNNAYNQGGGVFSFNGTLEVEKSDITGNVATYGDSDVLELATFIRGTPEQDVLTGTSSNDQIVSLDGNDIIDGQGGDDLLFGNGGSDIFVLAADNGQDFIADFVDGQDFIGLSGGLTYKDLTFSGQTINYGDQTLAVVKGIDTNSLTDHDFVIM